MRTNMPAVGSENPVALSDDNPLDVDTVAYDLMLERAVVDPRHGLATYDLFALWLDAYRTAHVCWS